MKRFGDIAFRFSVEKLPFDFCQTGDLLIGNSRGGFRGRETLYRPANF